MPDSAPGLGQAWMEFSNKGYNSILSLELFENSFKTSFSHHLQKKVTFNETDFSICILESIKM